MTAWQVTLTVLAAVLALGAYDGLLRLVTGRRRRSALARLLLTLVRAYQRWISPVRPPACRFTPSCSAYAVTAVERFGALRGGWLTTRRLLRCHPWNHGGLDPVPEPRAKVSAPATEPGATGRFRTPDGAPGAPQACTATQPSVPAAPGSPQKPDSFPSPFGRRKG